MEWGTEYMPNTLNSISICSVKKKNLQSLDSLGETILPTFLLFTIKMKKDFVEKVIEKSPNQRFFLKLFFMAGVGNG